MEFLISKDFASIAFIRCAALIPGSDKYAEGAGFTVSTAMEKCRSELAERQFYLEKRISSGGTFTCLGMAAHPEMIAAKEHAYLETQEYLAVEELAKNLEFRGLPIWNGESLKIWVSRTWDSFWAIVVFKYRGRTFATQSAARSRRKALLKAWAEYRKIFVFSPSVEHYASATLLNQKLGSARIEKIKFTPSFGREISAPMPSLTTTIEKRGTRFVAYVSPQSSEGTRQ
jgi:hypothetical protein